MSSLSSRPRWLAYVAQAFFFVGLGTVVLRTNASAQSTEENSVAQFKVEAKPILTISDDGTLETQFTSVVARRLSSGQVVVGDQGTMSIRVFRRDGTLERTLARSGRGPGEIPGFFLLSTDTDTVFSFGQPPGAPPDIHRYLATGAFLGQTRASNPSSPLMPVLDKLGTGQFLVQRGSGMRRLAESPKLGVLVPDSAQYGIYTPITKDSGNVIWLPPFVQAWNFAYPNKRGMLLTALSTYPFVPGTFVVAAGDRVWMVDGTSGTVRLIDQTGKEILHKQVLRSTEPFDRSGLSRRRARALQSALRAVDTSRANAMADPALLPRTMPVFSAAIAGPNGEIWLQRFSVDERAPRQFLVLNRDGVEIGRAALPGSIDVQHVGEDFVLGVAEEPSGSLAVVEYVVRR